MAIPTRGLLLAIRVLPVLVVVVLSAPAWLTWPFLSERRQKAVLEMVKALAEWTRDHDRKLPISICVSTATVEVVEVGRSGPKVSDPTSERDQNVTI
jgi:hypothetical protein